MNNVYFIGHLDILSEALNPIKNEGSVMTFVFLDEGLSSKFKFLNSFKCSKEFIVDNLDKCSIAAGLSRNSYHCRFVYSSVDNTYKFLNQDLIRNRQFRMFNIVVVKAVDLRTEPS